MTYDYDLFVIGGGSGGVRAGRLVAGLGNRVGIAEEYRYGGTCVIRGCVPKKLFVYASSFAEHFEDAKGFGWTVGDTSFDWPTLIDNKDQEIERLEGLYRKGLENVNADIFNSRAVLESPHKVRLLAEDKVVTAEKIMIAVGGTPNRQPDLPGYEYCITSDEVFHLKELPKSIVIAGGGYVAVEFAGVFAGLGVDTTIVYRGPEILRHFDMDLRRHLHQEMEKKGVRIICGETFKKVEQADGRLKVTLSGGGVLGVDQAMLAIGRLPLTTGLGAEKAGIELDRSGHIAVNEYSRTNVDNIWAVGDVSNRVPLTPVAIHESMCFIDTEYLGKPRMPDHDIIATAVFSHPEIGTVGLTEEEAAEKFDNLNVFKAVFRPMKHTLSGRDEKTMMKLIVDSQSDKVVGAHLLGPDAGEMVQLMAIPIKMGATKADFDRTMAVHPTAAEELVTMYQPSYQIVDGERITQT